MSLKSGLLRTPQIHTWESVMYDLAKVSNSVSGETPACRVVFQPQLGTNIIQHIKANDLNPCARFVLGLKTYRKVALQERGWKPLLKMLYNEAALFLFGILGNWDISCPRRT